MLRASSLWMPFLLWLFVSPAAASDLIAPISQDRWVSVYAFASDFAGSDEDSDSLAAPDFGLFQADRAATATVPNAAASSSSSQTSQVQSVSMQATGSISADGDAFDYEAFGSSNGVSHFEATFDLTGPASFALSGEIVAFGPQCSTTVALNGPSGPIVMISARSQTTPVLETGTLAPATYTLIVEADGRAYHDFFVYLIASASYDILFTVTSATGVPELGSGTGSSAIAAPNPFRERTTISYEIPGARVVDAAVFDLRGRLVRKLIGVEGDRALSWDGRNGLGEFVHPGVYFVRLEGGGEIHRLKVTRIR